MITSDPRRYYRALQQFSTWLAAEDQLPDPVAGLQPPRQPQAGPGLHQPAADAAGAGDTAIIAVFTAPGIRLSQLVGLQCSDVGPVAAEDHCPRQGRQDCIVRIGHQAARSLGTWTGTPAPAPGTPRARGPRCGSEPVTAANIYQMIARRGRQCAAATCPHRFRRHFSRTPLDRGGPEGDLIEPNA